MTIPTPAPKGRRFSRAGFFKYLGYEPHPGQLAIHSSTARIRVVACGVRFGKTHAASYEALAAAMEPRASSIGWVVAPTYDLATRVFRQVLLIARTKFPHRIVACREHEYYLSLRNLGGGISEIRAKSADNPVSLLGEGLDWVVIDEASRLKREVWENYISQRLIDRKGWALLISTPHGKNYFFDLWRAGQRGEAEIESFNMPSWVNPRLPRELIEEQRMRVPERSFNEEYGAQFTEGEGAVFRNVRERALGDWQDPKPGERYLGGLDLARVNDFTVLTLVNRACEVVRVERFGKIDWDLQVGRVKAASQRYNSARVLVDVTGVGGPVHESLLRAGVPADPFTFTASTKAALVSNLALLLEQRRITLPKPSLCPELIDELEAFQFSASEGSTGHVRTEAPSGGHDDCVVSLGLACWALSNAPMPPSYHVLSPMHQGGAAQLRRFMNLLRRP